MQEKAKTYKELEARNWCTNGYHQMFPLINWYVTDGIADLINSFDCMWMVHEFLVNKDVQNCTFGNFPRIEVENDEGKRIVNFYLGKVDEDGEDDAGEPPFKSIEDKCKCLPVGTLRFEVGHGDPEGKTHILALMSEH